MSVPMMKLKSSGIFSEYNIQTRVILREGYLQDVVWEDFIGVKKVLIHSASITLSTLLKCTEHE